jgi:hypothetical protein
MLFNMTLLPIILLLESNRSWKRVLELCRCKRDKIIADIITYHSKRPHLLSAALPQIGKVYLDCGNDNMQWTPYNALL